MGSATEVPGAAAARTAARAALALAASLQPRTTSKPPREARSLAATRPMPVLAPVMRTVLLFLVLAFSEAACALTTEGGEEERLWKE